MILDRFLVALDVDPRQWRALVRASYLLLKRNPASVKGLKTGSTSRATSVVVLLVFYFFLGVVFAFLPWGGSDPSIPAAIILLPTSFFISSLILLEFGATVIAPEDFSILSVHPVSSRTYFAARMSVVVLLTLLLAAVLNFPSAVALVLRRGVLEACVWIIAATGNALTTSMGMILLYTAALRVIPHRRFMSFMGYFQMAMSFLIYAGFGIFATRMGTFLAGMNIAVPWWWHFVPAVWFASLVALAAGIWSTENLLLACCGIVLLGILIPAAASKISLTYAESLSRASASAPARRHSPRFGGMISLLRGSEDRAIATLIARQFRYDIKFKMTVLGILPLTALYVYQGLQGGGKFYDPFQRGMDIRGITGSSLLYIAIILFPGILKDEIGKSDNFQAAWVFFTTPADRATLVLAVKRVLTVYFLVPYLLLLGFVFYYFFRNPLHVLMHEIVILLASQLLLQITFFISPRLPFSAPRSVGEKFGLTTFTLLLGPIVLLAMLLLFSRYFYTSPVSYMVGSVSLFLLVMVVESLLKLRVSKKVAGLEFAG